MTARLFILTTLCFILARYSTQAQNLHLENISYDSVQKLPAEIKSKTFSSTKDLLKEREEQIKLLHKIGYIEAYLLPMEKKNDSLFLNYIYIGEKIQHVTVRTQAEKWPIELKKEWNITNKKEIHFSFIDLERNLQHIKEAWQNYGYSLAEVHIENLKSKKDTLYGDLKITSNEVRYIDSIVVKGYDPFPIKILKHRFGLKPKQKLNHHTIQKASEGIEAIGIAKTTRAAEILYEQNKSSVYFYLEKLNNNYFDGIIGFATNEDTGKMEFSGNLDLSLHNNLNQGEKLAIQYRADGNQQQDVNIRLEIPYLGSSPISTSGGIRIFKKDSSYTNTDLDIKLSYDKKHWSYYFQYEKSKSVNLIEQTSIANNIASLDGNFYIVGVRYTKHDRDLLQPIKTYLDIKLGTGNRETDEDRQAQQKIELESFHNLHIFKNHSLYLKMQTKKLWSADYYTNELFRIGGLDHIRGFNENSIDVSQVILFQTEYRLRLTNDMHLHSITDIARIANKSTNTKESLIGIGFGIGIHNKLGLMRVQIANGTTSKESFDFDKTRIHISLHTRF